MNDVQLSYVDHRQPEGAMTSLQKIDVVYEPGLVGCFQFDHIEIRKDP